jgi:hypothetical protein
MINVSDLVFDHNTAWCQCSNKVIPLTTLCPCVVIEESKAVLLSFPLSCYCHQPSEHHVLHVEPWERLTFHSLTYNCYTPYSHWASNQAPNSLSIISITTLQSMHQRANYSEDITSDPRIVTVWVRVFVMHKNWEILEALLSPCGWV